MMFQTPKQLQANISLGVFLIWIGIIATAAGSFLYWMTILQIADPQHMATQDSLMKMSLYGMLLMAFAIEAYKKALLGSFQNRRLWYWLVFASVLTSIGGIMISDQGRQNTLNTSTASYASAVSSLDSAKAKRTQYARCKDFAIDQLDADLAANANNVPRHANGKKNWTKFNEVETQIAMDKVCLSAYENANSAVIIAEADLSTALEGGAIAAAPTAAGETADTGASRSSNPLMYSIHKLIGVAEKTLVMLFFILVTVLVEVVTFFLGSKVEKMKRQQVLTANELTIINVYETMGIDLSAKQDDIVAKGISNEMQYQLDEERQKQMFDIERQKMLNQLDAERRVVASQTSKQSVSTANVAPNASASPSVGVGVGLGSIGGVGFGVDFVKNLFGKNKANGPVIPSSATVQNTTSAGTSDLSGMTLDQVQARRDNYKAMPVGQRLCPYCSAKVPVASGTYYCDGNHQTAFNSIVKSLKSSGGTVS